MHIWEVGQYVQTGVSIYPVVNTAKKKYLLEQKWPIKGAKDKSKKETLKDKK